MRPLRAFVTTAGLVAFAGAGFSAWNTRALRHLRPAGPGHPIRPVTEPVSVLVPARDEAARIDTCIADLRATRGIADLEILVLDDASTDGTAEVVTATAAGDERIRLLRGTGEPPAGWLGKPFACARLADAATGSVLVFCDADVRLHPDALAATVADLRRSRSDLVSAWPRQVAVTWAARLIQPLQQWSWLTTIPLRHAARSPRPSLAAANGQLLCFDAAAYRSIGGHRAVAGSVLEDIELARAIKRAGYRADLVDAGAVASCLMYDTDRALFDGYTKSLWAAFGGPRRGVAATAALAALALTPPLYAVLGRHRPTRIVATGGYLALVANRLITDAATGSVRPGSAAGMPVALAGLCAMSIASAARLRRGTLHWRGRAVRSQPGQA